MSRSIAVRAIDIPGFRHACNSSRFAFSCVLPPSVSLAIDHQPALQTFVLPVRAHLSTPFEHGHGASVNQPHRAMVSFKERLPGNATLLPGYHPASN